MLVFFFHHADVYVAVSVTPKRLFIFIIVYLDPAASHFQHQQHSPGAHYKLMI